MQKLAIEYLLDTKTRFPDKTAVIDGDRSLTFKQLWVRALSLGYGISKIFNESGTPCVIDIPKSLEALVALLGIQLSGNIYAPLDPNTPRERRKRFSKSLGRHRIVNFKDDKFTIDGAPLKPGAGSTGEMESAVLAGLEKRNNIDPLYIIFTSGTTGHPKGVVVSNAAVIDYIDWALKTYSPDEKDIIGNQAPLFFDNSVLDIYLTLAAGCELHLINDTVLRFPGDLAEYISRHSVSFVFFVPSLLNHWAALDLLKVYDMRNLKKILFAGEAMPLDTVKYLRSRLPEALLSNLYGPTEITVDAVYWIFGDELDDLEDTPLGIPCENKQIIFLNENDQIVENPDSIAEIAVRGIGVSLGYWNEREKTNEAFVQNPAHNHYRDIIYKTGDLGYSKDGLIYFAGRKDRQFKHLGYRIEPGEIEAALNKIEGVSQCHVQYDSTKKEIQAFFTASSSLTGMRKILSSSLPQYMLPHRFIFLDRFPLKANGKTDVPALSRYLNESANGS